MYPSHTSSTNIILSPDKHYQQIMDSDPAYLPVVSIFLSRILDQIGLNSLTVKERRNKYLIAEHMLTWEERLVGRRPTIYHFGSQTEGATTPGLRSDLDCLICFDDGNVMQYWSEWKRGKGNLLMLQEDTEPGYCRLQALRPDKPLGREDLLTKHCIYDDRGRVIVKNTEAFHMSEADNLIYRNGPALSERNRHGFQDKDIVFAWKCKSWPAQAEEFTRRLRRYGWPSQELIQEVVQHGAFLVPVGHQLSPTKQLEWRISTSMAERCLMFSLTVVHLKCYVVLKMLMKTFVEPHVRKCISSYHCKTALLHCTENTDDRFWRDDNLVQCVIRCLELLLTWVIDGCCPHFILHEVNMFAGKVTAHNRHILQSILSGLIRRNGHDLLQIHLDDLGPRMLTKLMLYHLGQNIKCELDLSFNTEPSVVPILDSLVTLELIREFEFHLHDVLNCEIKEIMLAHLSVEPVPLIRCVCRKIDLLKYRMRQSDKHERQAIKFFIEFFSCWLGSLLASVALSNDRRIPPDVLELFPNETDIDVASMLKLASVIYCNGDLREVETILHTVEGHLSRNMTITICTCYETPISDQVKCALRGRKTRANLFAHCVRFSPQEMHCAPPELRTEFYRAVGDDVQNRDPRNEWMELAAVDSLPYLYFLQYMTYRQLGKQALKSRSLQNLDRCARDSRVLGHLETAWNLLGQCIELELKPNAAMACYRTSLNIRPRDNAAKWRIAILLYRLIQQT